jgi:hypothetical protein
MTGRFSMPRGRLAFVLVIAAVAALAAGVTALLVNIFERKVEQRTPYVRVIEVTENDTDPALAQARQLQRRAQWRLDFIAAENSMGFHAPQEAARVLGEAIDYARQGQIAVLADGVPFGRSEDAHLGRAQDRAAEEPPAERARRP